MKPEQVQKNYLELRERIALAEGGLDLLGRDCRIFPPPISTEVAAKLYKQGRDYKR